jgi:hypothetical protein
MNRTYGTHLAENVADFQDLQLWASAQVVNLIHTVGHNNLVKGTGVDALDSVATQDSMSDKGIYLRCTFPLEQLGSTSNGIGGVRQIINQNGYPITDIANQHHGGILAVSDFGGAALLRTC